MSDAAPPEEAASPLSVLRQAAHEAQALADGQFARHGVHAARAWYRLADALGSAGQLDAALEAADRSVALFERCHELNTAFSDNLLLALELRSLIPVGQGEPARRLAPLRRIVHLRVHRRASRPGGRALVECGQAQIELAETLELLGRRDEAQEHVEAALQNLERATAHARSHRPAWIRGLAAASVLRDHAGTSAQALVLFKRAVTACDMLVQDAILDALEPPYAGALPTSALCEALGRGARQAVQQLDQLREMLDRRGHTLEGADAAMAAARLALEQTTGEDAVRSLTRRIAQAVRPGTLRGGRRAPCDRVETLERALRAAAVACIERGDLDEAREHLDLRIAMRDGDAASQTNACVAERQALLEDSALLLEGAGAADAARSLRLERIRLLRAGIAHDPSLRVRLGSACETMARAATADGAYDTSEAWLREAVEAYRGVPDNTVDNPRMDDTSGSELLALACVQWAAAHVRRGDPKAAHRARQEALAAFLGASRALIAAAGNMLEEAIESMLERLYPGSDESLVDELDDSLLDLRRAVEDRLEAWRAAWALPPAQRADTPDLMTVHRARRLFAVGTPWPTSIGSRFATLHTTLVRADISADMAVCIADRAQEAVSSFQAWTENAIARLEQSLRTEVQQRRLPRDEPTLPGPC